MSAGAGGPETGGEDSHARGEGSSKAAQEGIGIEV